MKLPITIKECAGVGVSKWPVLVVVPVPEGQYQNTDGFRVVDAGGETILSQIEVLNRWWGKDNSIRHLRVQFFVSVSAWQKSASTGIASYYLQDDETDGGTWESQLEVNESLDGVHVSTGVMRFSVPKQGFAINDVVIAGGKSPLLHASSLLTDRLGSIIPDSVRKDTNIAIEETGPVRSVLRISAPTVYVDPGNHLHGFCVRLYAYAGLPYINIEYQLQNSDYQRKFSWPLYFKSLNLRYQLPVSESSRLVRLGLENQVINSEEARFPEVRQLFHDKADYLATGETEGVVEVHGTQANGFIDVSDGTNGIGITALSRYFWQQWPNGLRVNESGQLLVELWPEWSSQWIQGPPKAGNPHFTDAGLYWLDDMQHVIKKTMLYFHEGTATDSDLLALSKTYNEPPVPVLPVSWYRQTGVTLDLDGVIPSDKSLATSDKRKSEYRTQDYNPAKATNYQFGWDSYRVDIYRKYAPASAGGWPFSVSAFYGTQNPLDFRYAEEFTLGELNCRPQWLPVEYRHELDWQKLKLTQAPYSGTSWRAFEGHGKSIHADPVIDGTVSPTAKPRDDEHAWFYHVLETYYLTGDYWIKDWYQFIAEFRRIRLLILDDYPDMTTRALAHGLSHAIHAYQVTGKSFIMEDAERFITGMAKRQWRLYGCIDERIKTRSPDFEQTYELGYFVRALISYLSELPETSTAYAKAFQLLSGCMAWNLHIARFSHRASPYYQNDTSSSYISQAFADVQGWYFWETGKTPYFDQLKAFSETGINNKDNNPAAILPAYSRRWIGGFHGRFIEAVLDGYLHRETTPPAPVSDLTAVIEADNVRLNWTATVTGGRFHLVYADRPISESYSNDPEKINWWAADTVGVELRPVDGGQCNMLVPVKVYRAKYFAVFTFNDANDMSDMAMTNVIAESAKRVRIEASWQDANSKPVEWQLRWKTDGEWIHAMTSEKQYTIDEITMLPGDKVVMQVQAVNPAAVSDWSEPAEYIFENAIDKPATPFSLTLRGEVID